MNVSGSGCSDPVPYAEAMRVAGRPPKRSDDSVWACAASDDMPTMLVRAHTATPTPMSERMTRPRWIRSSWAASTTAPTMEVRILDIRGLQIVVGGEHAVVEAVVRRRETGDRAVVGDRHEGRTRGGGHLVEQG